MSVRESVLEVGKGKRSVGHAGRKEGLVLVGDEPKSPRFT